MKAPRVLLLDLGMSRRPSTKLEAQVLDGTFTDDCLTIDGIQTEYLKINPSGLTP